MVKPQNTLYAFFKRKDASEHLISFIISPTDVEPLTLDHDKHPLKSLTIESRKDDNLNSLQCDLGLN